MKIAAIGKGDSDILGNVFTAVLSGIAALLNDAFIDRGASP